MLGLDKPGGTPWRYSSAMSPNSLAARGSGAWLASCAMACAKDLRTDGLPSALAAASRACAHSRRWCMPGPTSPTAILLHFKISRGLPRPRLTSGQRSALAAAGTACAHGRHRCMPSHTSPAAYSVNLWGWPAALCLRDEQRCVWAVSGEPPAGPAHVASVAAPGTSCLTQLDPAGRLLAHGRPRRPCAGGLWPRSLNSGEAGPCFQGFTVRRPAQCGTPDPRGSHWHTYTLSRAEAWPCISGPRRAVRLPAKCTAHVLHP